MSRDDFIFDHPIVPELERRGVKLIGEGDELKACCPFHDDKNPSFSVTRSSGLWNCFAGCGGGSVIDLIAKYEKCSPEDLLRNSNGHTKEITPLKEVDWKACVEKFGEKERARICQIRGYSPEFVDHLAENKLIGMCDGKLAFPIHTAGKVTGTHQKNGDKWLIVGGSQKAWIIGDHFEMVHIFESQWDAFAFMQLTNWFSSPALRSQTAIVITRGAQNFKLVQNMFPTKGDVLVWMQNDPVNEAGESPALSWLSGLVSILRKVRVCKIPPQHKDLNDWLRNGAKGSDLLEICQTAESYRDPKLPPAKPPMDYKAMMAFNPKEDPDCLLGNRYLCRGGSAIWVGGSGLGKSVITIQAAITFCLNESLFGIQPKKPLKSIIFSAEDDKGDISETVQGVLKGMGITESDPRFNLVVENVLIFQEPTMKGLNFIGYIEQTVKDHKADFVWINPLLSYYIGNPSDPEESAKFTGALSVMQENTGVCTMLVHHTGKPKDTKTTSSWSVDDFSYIGLGSSVWTNWARAILVLQALKEPKNTFVLRFAKRGQRIGVVNDEFEKVREVYLEHAQEGLRWVESDYLPESSGQPHAGGRAKKDSWPRFRDSWDGTPLTQPEIKSKIKTMFRVSDKTATRIVERWTGEFIIKNTDDLWKKNERDITGQ